MGVRSSAPDPRSSCATTMDDFGRPWRRFCTALCPRSDTRLLLSRGEYLARCTEFGHGELLELHKQLVIAGLLLTYSLLSFSRSRSLSLSSPADDLVAASSSSTAAGLSPTASAASCQAPCLLSRGECVWACTSTAREVGQQAGWLAGRLAGWLVARTLPPSCSRAACAHLLPPRPPPLLLLLQSAPLTPVADC